ncbi:MAG TPA: Lar family restriction alleviation protein [Candidatus Paceibacterota bacterium]|nr:Lar family restriction alleviation protein [Candidatus Paceibacterota bacterium]
MISKNKLKKINELKPCPFCGSKKVAVDQLDINNDFSDWHCCCLEDGCHGNIYMLDSGFGNKKAAVDAWNMRVL